MRDVNSGWLIRYLHANGASMFFIAVYIHIFRGLYYGSYKAPREIIWVLGITNLLIMMATAFLGYVLPWGQMSFWGATVITNLFSAIPLVGETIVEYLWGGYSVGNPTLNRFFSLHYLLPFMLVGTVTLHIWALHHVGQNNPTGVEVTDFKKDTVPFTPYATVKDVFGIACFMIFFAYWVFYIPNYLGHADNYIPANPAVTPAHIVPEWYFLPFYAVLRAVPDKLGGVSRCSWQSSSWRSCPGLRPPRCARCTIVRLRGLCSGCLLSHSLALGTSAACRQRAAMWSPLGSSQCCTWDTLLLYLWSACLKGHYRCPCRSLSLY
jgi:quinol-cytochrome oxidoreductase complex cytochrome b subunit